MNQSYDLPVPRSIAVTFTGAILVLLIIPALVVVPISFSSGAIMAFPLPGISSRWYQEVLTSPTWSNAAKNTFLIGSITTVMATSVGTLAALGINRLGRRGKMGILLFALSPLMIPIVIVALGAYLVLVKLGLNNTYFGVILIHTTLGLPFVTISVSSALQGFDHNLWRAAASLGAKPLFAFRRVMLPIISPGIATGAVFAFATSLDEVVVASFVTAPSQKTIPLQMFSGIKDNTSPNVTAAATLLLLLSVVFLGAIEVLRRRSERLSKRSLQFPET